MIKTNIYHIWDSGEEICYILITDKPQNYPNNKVSAIVGISRRGNWEKEGVQIKFDKHKINVHNVESQDFEIVRHLLSENKINFKDLKTALAINQDNNVFKLTDFVQLKF